MHHAETDFGVLFRGLAGLLGGALRVVERTLQFALIEGSVAVKLGALGERVVVTRGKTPAFDVGRGETFFGTKLAFGSERRTIGLAVKLAVRIVHGRVEVAAEKRRDGAERHGIALETAVAAGTVLLRVGVGIVFKHRGEAEAAQLVFVLAVLNEDHGLRDAEVERSAPGNAERIFRVAGIVLGAVHDRVDDEAGAEAWQL